MTHTSAFARISHPVISDRDLILNKGVLPIHDSIPTGIAVAVAVSDVESAYDCVLS